MKSIIFFSLILLSVCSHAQMTTYAQTFGSTNIEQISGLQVNQHQEIFAIGTFGENMTIGNNNLLINGLEDIFLFKKNAAGQTTWTKTFGSNDRDKVAGFRLFQNTALYFSGIFWDNILFDTISLSANGSSIFVTKCDTLGNPIWAKAINGDGLKKINEGITDSQGNYIITGSFSNNLYFPNNTLSAIGSEDGFIAKYDQNGNFLWVKQFGYQQQTRATSITVDGLNNIYVAGEFNGRVIFGNDTLWAAANDFDIFLAQFDDLGNLQFGKRFGGVYDNMNPKIGIGSFGKIVMAGTFIGLLNFDQTQIQTNNLDSDIFLATLTPTGDLIDVTQFGGNTNETLENLTVSFDDYYLSGYFNSATQIGNVGLTTAFGNIQNLLLRTTDNQFNLQPNIISYNSVAPSSTRFVVPYNSNADIAIAGIFQGTLNLPVSMPSPVANGFTDIFLVRVVLPPVSTSTANNDLNISIFPNPANHTLTIDLNEVFVHSPIEITITNQVGQVVQILNITNQNLIRVPIYHLPKGIYFVILQNEEVRIVRKIIKN